MTELSVEQLRESMGTNPAKNLRRKDEIFAGCQGIKVTMLDQPSNPYEAIFEGAAATWGDRENWAHKKVDTAGRLMVILSVLGRKTLPEILEAPKFTFQIEGASRAAFDQYARHRIGVGINSVGTRDNDWADAAIRLPWEVVNDKDQMEMHTKAYKAAKDAYMNTVDGHHESWQSGRFILPMGTCHNWVMSANYLAMQNIMFQRTKFCEQFDTVGVAWLLRHEVEKQFPLLGAFLRPGCDWAGKCQYHNSYNLSELFGCLFSGCGRHKVEGGEKYTEFNRACSTPKEIEDDLRFNFKDAKDPRDQDFHIPKGGEWKSIVRKAIDLDNNLHYYLFKDTCEGRTVSETLDLEWIMKKVMV